MPKSENVFRFQRLERGAGMQAASNAAYRPQCIDFI
jgi:hypothetical protein